MTNFIQKVINDVVIATQHRCGRCNHKEEQVSWYREEVQKILHKHMDTLMDELKGEGATNEYSERKKT